MHLDITKYIKSCKIEKLEIINNIGVINLYNINNLVIYNEVSDAEFNMYKVFRNCFYMRTLKISCRINICRY